MCEVSEPDDVTVARSESDVVTSGDGRDRLMSRQPAAVRRTRGSSQSRRHASVKRRDAARTCCRRCESDTSLVDITQSQQHTL